MGTIKLKRMRWVGHVACMGLNRNVYWILVVKPGGHTPLGRSGYRWKDNIKMDLQETVGWHSLNTSGTAWGEVVGSCEHHAETGSTK